MLGVGIALGLELAFLLGHLPLEVSFVPNKDLDGLMALVLLEHIIPGLEVGKCGLLRNIIDHHCAVRIFHVVGDKTAKSLLPSRIPKLNAVLFAIT